MTKRFQIPRSLPLTAVTHALDPSTTTSNDVISLPVLAMLRHLISSVPQTQLEICVSQLYVLSFLKSSRAKILTLEYARANAKLS